MQVLEIVEPNSYAIAGGGNFRSAEIARSAHAFTIMGDTLYQDKERAVPREVICNAADAHAEAGYTGPIEITLTKDEFTVKDSGPGIPDEKMVEVYMTLFGSTKELDDGQTGGFGLGSKAPFALTEHFTVTSSHKGERRIYVIHKGDEESEGIPGVRPMAGPFPTDQSGLIVQIPINEELRGKLHRNILAVVREGGINATLNGEPIETRDLTGLKEHGFAQFPVDDRRDDPTVLFSNVVYPISWHADLRDLLNELNALKIEGHQWAFYAPPSSITPQPSREGLSYTPRTLKTIKKLLKKAINEVKPRVNAEKRRQLDAVVKQVKPEDLLDVWNRPGKRPARSNGPFVGAEAIVHGIANRWISGTGFDARDVGRAARRLHPSFRIEIKRLYNKEYLAPFIYQYRMRRILKALNAIGFAKNLKFRWLKGKQLRSVLEEEPTSHEANRLVQEPFKLVMAPNIVAAATYGEPGFYVVSGKVREDAMLTLIDRCEKLGIELELLDKPEVARKPKKTPEQIEAEKKKRVVYHMTLNFGYVTQNYYDFLDVKRPDYIAFEPQSYLLLNFHNSETLAVPKGHVFKNMGEWLGKIFPDVAVAHGVNARKRYEEAKVKRFEDVVLDHARKRLKKRKSYEAFYMALARFITLDRGRGNYETESLAEAMLTTSRRMAHLAVGDLTYKADPDRDEAWRFWMGAFALFHKRADSGNFHVDHNHRDLLRKDKETFEKLVDGVLFTAKADPMLKKIAQGALPSTAHLMILKKLVVSADNVRSLNKDYHEEFCDLVQDTLKRRLAKERMKKTTAPVTEALKEAA